MIAVREEGLDHVGVRRERHQDRVDCPIAHRIEHAWLPLTGIAARVDEHEAIVSPTACAPRAPRRFTRPLVSSPK
jgi:hypothetical protein